MLYSNSAFRPLALVAMTFLAVATSTGMSLFGSSSTTSPGSSQIAVTTNDVAVTRETPFTDLDELRTDATVLAVTADVADYRAANPGVVDPSRLAKYLAGLHQNVSAASEGDPWYEYRIGPDGSIIEICHDTSSLTIDDGGSSPVLVRLDLTVRL